MFHAAIAPDPDHERVAHPTAQKRGLFGVGAAWLRFTTAMELRRLATLHVRIERRQRAIDDLMAERRLIMNRCIRRMRRAQGKQ